MLVPDDHLFELHVAIHNSGRYSRCLHIYPLRAFGLQSSRKLSTMASHNATSYAAIPKRHSNDRLSLDDISPDARFKSNSSYEYPLARDSVSDDESHPRITESTSTAQAVPLAGEHESKGDVVQPVQWRVSLYTPLSMIALFISGLLVAVGHHIFYSRLVGTYVRGPEEGYISQVWIIRYGTAFAFVTKTLLAGSIVIAYKQYMWINLQHKANSVSTIDAVFAATHDLLAFLHPSFWSRAKIPALMALIAWLVLRELIIFFQEKAALIYLKYLGVCLSLLSFRLQLSP
jgi:hypothetical protein